MRRRPLPLELERRPFSVRDSGLPAKRLRASDLDRSVRGTRQIVSPDEPSYRSRCERFAIRLAGNTFFSHTSAARLLGAPLPLHVELDPTVHISVAAPLPSPHAQGLIGHRLAVDDGDVVTSRGLRHTSAARTWCDLATLLTLDDLVAVGDYFVHWRSPFTSVEAIARRVAGMNGARGIRLARVALPLLSDRPESRQESRLRLIVLRGGLPEPEINHEIVDSETGRHVRPDFIFRKHKLILEYQGDYHRTKKQWRKDMTRRSRLEADGWYVMELNADDLDDPRELVARIQRALARRS
jgi:hypothetical protein